MKFKRRRVWSSILIGLGSSTSIIDNGWSYIVGEHMLHTWFHYYFLFISCVLFLSCSVQTPYLLVVSFQAWHVRYAHDMSIECVEMPTHTTREYYDRANSSSAENCWAFQSKRSRWGGQPSTEICWRSSVESVIWGASLIWRGWPSHSWALLQTYEVAVAATCWGFYRFNSCKNIMFRTIN